MEQLVCERNGPVAYVRLNRPAARNALSLELIEGLTKCFADLSADPEIRVIVLSGNGRHFCAGADLEWMQASAKLDDEGNRREAKLLGDLFTTIDSSPKAIIGDIGGAAIGGGAGLAAVCDYVVAIDDAFFAFSEVRVGLIPAVIGPFVLAKLSASATRAYFTSGVRFDAKRAQEIGLVHEVVEVCQHHSAIQRIVDSYLASAPGAIAEAKALLRTLVFQRPTTAPELQAYTAEAIAQRRVSEEAQQGLTAFLEHRKAPWIPEYNES